MSKIPENFESIEEMVNRWNAEDDGFTYSMKTEAVALSGAGPVEFRVVINVEPIK